MADVRTQRLPMVSWTAELIDAVLHDSSPLETIVGATLAPGFPNHPVRNLVLPTTLARVRCHPGYGWWNGMIVHTGDRVVIGSMGFKAPPDDDGAVEIGYDIVPNYQGQGYATEMGRAFVHGAWQQPSVRPITAECLSDNLASIRVMEKLGMQRAAEQDHMLDWAWTIPE